MEFTVTTLINIPATCSGEEIIGADIVCNFGIGDTGILNKRIADKYLPVIDKEGGGVISRIAIEAKAL